ncbi:MAG: ABC transporter substrate-binding protein, partial [Alphaproteobacteria bacterium]
MLRTVLMATIVVVGAGGQPAMAASGTNGPAHGLAMHGAPKYAADFTHFDYVNPDAPKGGAQVSEAIGTYDSLNAFIISGNPAVGVGLIYDSLTVSALDEPFTQYCLLCETMEVPDDRSWVEYTLREDARWHDGMPITVEDVIFSFNVLREQGHPFYRAYYSSIA